MFRINAITAASLLAAAALGGASPRAARGADEMQELFNGQDMSGWKSDGQKWTVVGGVPLAQDDPRRFDPRPGTGVFVNGAEGKADNLFTQREFGDLELHLEFVVPEGSNSGVYFQGRYEIQILDSFGVMEPKYSDCGGIYQRWKDDRGFEGHAPSENASLPPGEWQTFEIVFRAPRFDADGNKVSPARFERVMHNGKLIHEGVDLTGPTRASAWDDERPTGPIMLQGDHGPVAFRNVRFRVPEAADGEQATALRLPGVQPAGQVLLPNQWSLLPAGRQIKLGDFPVQIALHPSQPWAAVLHAGYGEHEVAVVSLENNRVVSRAAIEQTFYGLAFDPEGKRLFVSGAEHEVIHQFDFKDGYLSAHRTLAVGRPEETFVPAGLACSADGKTLYVANGWGSTVCLLPLSKPLARQHVPLPANSYPYAVLPAPDGKRLWVSLWAKSAVGVVNLESPALDTTWTTEQHPTEMVLSPDGRHLYVACANSNKVSVLDASDGRGLEVIHCALYAQAPTGSTPNSLALTPDGKVLFVANADNNNVAVVDVSEPGHARPLGYIPVGWYPTSVRFSQAANRILVANGKGLSSQANPQGPQPLKDVPASVEQYIGGLFRGTLSLIDSPSPAEMAELTRRAYTCSPLLEDNRPTGKAPEAGNPIPARLGDASPIKHCLYIIKENRTYDQVLGDMPEGNGDPNLCIFPEHVTPNHHALARQFVLLDNFYVESEVSADGHEWSMAAYATDFVEKTWPLVYRPGGKGKLVYPSEGEAAGGIARPAGGYIWDRCLAAGVTYRSYGEFISNGATPDDPATTNVEALKGHFDPKFRSYDLDYPDAKRADRFLEELAAFEKTGDLPQFIVLRLPNDHTWGQSAGKPTPTAMVAENDLALGRLIDRLSRSRFWKEMAVFVVEDDAQNGSDHVDAHRTVAFAISPYTRRGTVDSTMYSTSSMLRTMELILGLEPMSQFDAAARPMYASFQAEPDLTPYSHLPANVDLTETTPGGTVSARLSAAMDFSKEDAADDLLLNSVIWKSVRGEDAVMPPPVRAGFVFAEEEEGE